MKNIAEMRERSAVELASIKDGNYEEAKSLMNSYYRLVGLCERATNDDNNSVTYNEKLSNKYYNKIDKWEKRLNERFSEYGMELIYFGYFPSICYKGTTKEANITHFYD